MQLAGWLVGGRLAGWLQATREASALVLDASPCSPLPLAEFISLALSPPLSPVLDPEAAPLLPQLRYWAPFIEHLQQVGRGGELLRALPLLRSLHA